MIKNYQATLLFFTLLIFSLGAQEIKTFSTQDFELKGKVKSCQIITDYGSEILDFDVDGQLVKSTTSYSEQDKDITYYRFKEGFLKEIRLESYKDNTLDQSSSMAYIYSIDTTETKKIVEQVISYDKEFFEAQEYQYNKEGRLVKIISSHQNAVDETVVEYTTFKDEETITYIENGVLQNSIRTSYKKVSPTAKHKIVLSKNFVDGEPMEANEKVYGPKGNLLAHQLFKFDGKEQQFKPIEKHTFVYDKEDVLQKEVIIAGNVTSKKEYIFQFDNNTPKNWVKKICTPGNDYTTRKITYYPEVIEKQVD
ncbi:hypothetical protein [Croceivirga sp. JEA036]|uniref:hypothetical protein n=1 Tax=Croceivirga sp. JEA036 TaxID=2721162 RepID=UPI00143A285E|nr:hypothetical protein [Croceivirga sp. JEA036]NJB35467.1 hypothetical protein [Croceivirga sp. JEA036]